MSLIVPRTVTVVDGERNRSDRLAQFRRAKGYVLLGDPGAGKSTAFQTEVEAEPENSALVTARSFLGRSLEHHPEWKSRTLFIDGLDEVRAGRVDARRPLDLIIERLERLGNPDFRISCRAADWLGRNDVKGIVTAAGYENVQVLRLEPLSDEPILRILEDLGVPDPTEFVAKARGRGLEAMLDNPLLLGLLLKATNDDEWPDNRRDTLELACRKLACEWNEEHRDARRSAPRVPVDRRLNAAGHLSALLLLSDRERVSLVESEDSDTLCPEDISEGDQPGILRALKSNLFAARVDGSLVPAHRQLEEFLAARFLHRRITTEPGVPASRIFALMTGEDGVVVTELRGLSAWLAAFDRDFRLPLIETDPIGTALYGDVSAFQRDELESLFLALAERADELQPWFWSAVALKSLIRRDSVDLLGRYLSEADRTEGRQAVIGLLLHALSCAEGARPCLDGLEGAVRDATWQPRVRQPALRALILHSGDREALIALLDDLREGEVEDESRELRGRLLDCLYPVDVGPQQIWDYWEPRESWESYAIGGTWDTFWHFRLLKNTGTKDAVPLLQSLTDRGMAFRKRFLDDRLYTVVQELVLQVLSDVGEQTAAATVYDWLEVINFPESDAAHPRRPTDPEVSRWIADHPALQKRLAIEGLNRLSAADRPRAPDNSKDPVDRRYRAGQIRRSIFMAGEPDSFAEWCLEEAADAAATRVDVAMELLDWSRPWREGDSGTGLSVEEVRAATRGIPALQREVPLLLRRQKASLHPRPVSEEEKEYWRRRAQEQADFIADVVESAAELKAGTCGARLLHRIAESYHDFFFDDRESQPRVRVERLLGGNRDLTDAAIEGFRRVTQRDDLPSLREVIRLDEQGRISLFALPILAGLDDSPELLESPSPPEVRRAVGLYLLTPLNVDGHPAWYRRVLESRPESVAEALIKVTRSRIRRREDCVYLWCLPREEAYRAVARLVALPLLRSFPTRCTEPQISALNEILLGAIKWDVEGLEALTQQRMARADLDVAQRALWLAAGLFHSPEAYLTHVVKFVEEGEEARSRHMVRFLAPNDMGRLPMRWGSNELRTLVALLGNRYTPWRPESFGMGGVVEEDRTKVEALIAGWATTLASRTDRDACSALQALVDDTKLEPWHILLKDKRDEQVLARRRATFAIPDLEAVQRTLANEEPATVSDLAALVADRLERLSKEISRGSTDEWRHFWNEKEHARPRSPKQEESCSKAIVTALRRLLPSSLDAQREAVYARDRRADIRVSFREYAIPVEIKKDSNPRLWSAVDDQLADYSSAPESSGYGIYLVLWFGGADMQVPPSGPRPKTPDKLRKRLESQLAGPLRHRIRVIVIDVSGGRGAL